MASNPSVLTKTIPADEELMALPKDGCKRELLNGEIVMSPGGSEHGRKIVRFTTAFATCVYQHDLGEVFEGQTGFRMKKWWTRAAEPCQFTAQLNRTRT